MDAKETLRALDEDVARLLLAGGSLAGTDDALNARKDALATFGAKVPVLAKVAEQVGKVTGAKPRAATSELLALAAMSWQLRAAQSQPAKAEGALGAVPHSERLDTPLAAHEIEPIYDVLSRKGSGRRERLDDALERGAARDLRLLVPWVEALADRDSEVADEAAERGVPSLGLAAVPLVEAGLRVEEGNASDARRLRCLAKIQGAAVRPLLDRALAKGSVGMRAAALTALAGIDPAAAETVAVRAIADRAPIDVRLAAIEALGSSHSDAALDALIEALSEGDNVQRQARQALKDVAHPDATKRLLALLTPEVVNVKPYVSPKAKKGLTPAQQKAAQKAEREAYAAVSKKEQYVTSVIAAFGKRKDPAVEARLIELWKDNPNSSIVDAAGHALVAMGTPRAYEAVLAVLATVTAKDSDRFEIALEAALLQPPARAYELLSPFLSDAALKVKGASDPANSVLTTIEYADDEIALDPRWGDLLLGLAKHKDLGQQALESLVRVGHVSSFEKVVALLDDKKLVSNAAAVLASLKDKRATAPLVALLERKDVNLHDVLGPLRSLDDVATIAPLRAQLEKLTAPTKKGTPNKYADSWQVRQIDRLLQFLERDRTLS